MRLALPARSGGTGLTALLAVLFVTWLLASAPAAAADHVLVMTISEYARAPLRGVAHDAQNALQLARKLGYDTTRAAVLKDGQLTGSGMRAAFGALLGRVQRNDRVFIYFSGHGYSIAQRGTCVQGLVAHDEALVPTAELSSQLDAIKALVSDALVIFDACFSGGNRDISVTRAFEPGAARAGAPLHAKVWTPQGGERCEAATNELSKAWAPQSGVQEVTRSLVFPQSNFTFIAAATEREVALDDGDHGGLATLSLLQCATEGVPTAVGLVTARELATCAQQHVVTKVQAINKRLERQQYLPHQLVVYGNADKIFAANAVAAVAAPGLSSTRMEVREHSADLVLAAFEKFAASSNGN